MGISHPLSDEFYGGMLLMSPPSSPPAPVDNFLQHEVSRMDTLAGIAIKYGVQISDIKRANSLVSDSQMYAHKALLIPLPGRPMPSSVRLNSSSQRSKRAWAPNNQQNRDIADSLDSSNSSQQRSSLAMSSLQSYYGLSSQRGDDSTEMSSYSKGSSLDEALLNSSSPPVRTDRIRNLEDTPNCFSATGGSCGVEGDGATKERQDVSVRRRQKVEAETSDDLISDSIKMIKSFLPRPIAGTRLNTDRSSPDPVTKSNGSFLQGFKSALRKSPSASSFAETENNTGVSMWSSSRWAFNHESFTRPLLDGLPKPAPVRRGKAALD